MPTRASRLVDALDADGANLDRPPVLHGLDDADQSSVDEMDVLDRMVDPFEFVVP